MPQKPFWDLYQPMRGKSIREIDGIIDIVYDNSQKREVRISEFIEGIKPDIFYEKSQNRVVSKNRLPTTNRARNLFLKRYTLYRYQFTF